MKKLMREKLVIALFVTVVATIVSIGFNIKHCVEKKADVNDSVEFHPAKELAIDYNFYPGRIDGDYSDLVFSFSDYLEYIGAENVQRYIYESCAGINEELRFTYDGFDYIVTTSIFEKDCLHGIYTSIRAISDKGVVYGVPTENCGTFVMDYTTPFIMDRKMFDLLHIATDKKSSFRQELRAGMEENECPFSGFGIAHYEKWADGTTIWHDDVGEFTVDDGLDLHY